MKVQMRAMGVVCAVLCSAGFLMAQQGGAPKPAMTPSQEMKESWDDIMGKLVTMANDFPEDKYDFKVQKDQRTFAQNILHVAGVDYIVLSSIAGKKMGPEGKDRENPGRDIYNTKAKVAELMTQVKKDGDELIDSQGDAGLNAEVKYPFGNRMDHAWDVWMVAIEHAGEHYGQLVVYYRANGLVPPESRH
jgi:uncharacterized damage-inducible protein DinB